MHYRDITRKALGLHLITTGGLTPEATMYAAVLTEIQRQIKRGNSRGSRSSARATSG
jgi:restriction system protein